MQNVVHIMHKIEKCKCMKHWMMLSIGIEGLLHSEIVAASAGSLKQNGRLVILMCLP